MKKCNGQITIFAIIAVVLVGVLILAFLFKSEKLPSLIKGFEEDPQRFIENCLEEKIKITIETMEKRGGEINPSLYKKFKFSDENEYQNISFLCYTSKSYFSCENQKPVLINSLEEEIKKQIQDEKTVCLNEWKTGMEKRDYQTTLEEKNFDVELEPDKVILLINSSIKVVKKEEILNYNNFRIVIASRLYNLAVVSQEISAQEAEYCNFDNIGYMLSYPSFDIDKFRTSDFITIYTVKDKKSNEKFRFAVRGCVVPQTMFE